MRFETTGKTKALFSADTFSKMIEPHPRSVCLKMLNTYAPILTPSVERDITQGASNVEHSNPQRCAAIRAGLSGFQNGYYMKMDQDTAEEHRCLKLVPGLKHLSSIGHHALELAALSRVHGLPIVTFNQSVFAHVMKYVSLPDITFMKTEKHGMCRVIYLFPGHFCFSPRSERTGN